LRQVFGNQDAVTVAAARSLRIERLQAGAGILYDEFHPIVGGRGPLLHRTLPVVGIRAAKKRIRRLMERSLMLVTALAPKIGYDNAPRSPNRRMRAEPH